MILLWNISGCQYFYSIVRGNKEFLKVNYCEVHFGHLLVTPPPPHKEKINGKKKVQTFCWLLSFERSTFWFCLRNTELLASLSASNQPCRHKAAESLCLLLFESMRKACRDTKSVWVLDSKSECWINNALKSFRRKDQTMASLLLSERSQSADVGTERVKNTSESSSFQDAHILHQCLLLVCNMHAARISIRCVFHYIQ